MFNHHHCDRTGKLKYHLKDRQITQVHLFKNLIYINYGIISTNMHPSVPKIPLTLGLNLVGSIQFYIDLISSHFDFF